MALHAKFLEKRRQKTIYSVDSKRAGCCFDCHDRGGWQAHHFGKNDIKRQGRNIMKKYTCIVCSKEYVQNDVIASHGIRHEINKLILKDHPVGNHVYYICKNDYEKYRINHVTKLIVKESGQLKRLESEVLRNLSDSEILASNINKQYEEKNTIGNKISDKVAKFGGSWKFIISFFSVLVLWILINSHLLLSQPFDPYPFILMNLILSCIAAIQAPIIMMSQNRLETKDRMRAENDYKINLKSEIEIRTLHEKMDHLLLEQWSKMIEIQELQIDFLKDIKESMGKKDTGSGRLRKRKQRDS